MASKYEKLKGRYPEAPVGDLTSASNQKYIEKVEARKFTYAELSIPELMALMVGFNQEWDELKGRIGELNIEYAAIGRLLKDHFAAIGVNSMKSETGMTFYLDVKPCFGVTNDDALESYVEERPELHYLWGINASRRDSMIKELLDTGRDSEIPPMITVYLRTGVKCRKS